MWLILSLALTLLPHPFFVSVTEIEYLPKEKILGVSCKIFYDDLENTLKTFSGKNVDILKGDKQQNTPLIKAYLDKHFTMSIDGKPIAYKIIGYENEGEACFIYLEAPVAESPKKLTVQTDLLYDFNRSQINMLHYTVDGKRQSHKLSFPEKTVVFN